MYASLTPITAPDEVEVIAIANAAVDTFEVLLYTLIMVCLFGA